ncbi:unnamed protein product, partial [Medioppia subpectinata]
MIANDMCLSSTQHNPRFNALLTQLLFLLFICHSIHCMPEEERIQLRDEAREMFNHGYDSYMAYAYPADEL